MTTIATTTSSSAVATPGGSHVVAARLVKKSEIPALKTPGLAVQLLTAGTAACVADIITFPLDTTKVRLQIQGENLAGAGNSMPRYNGVYGTLTGVVKNEGPRALYNGLAAGLQRQMAFSAIRIGAYDTVKQKYTEMSGYTSGGGFLMVRIAAGMTTGTLAILAAQPTDVVKIRMQAEMKLPGQKSRYRGVFNAYYTIGKFEGMAGLYKGTLPNIARNCIINVGEIVVYDVTKEAFISSGLFKDGIKCHFSAAVVAGFCATVIASPVDVIKTRFMNSPKGRYSGALSVAIQTAKNEGFLAFYKGFTASFTRLVAWNICLWVTYEQLKKGILYAYNNNSSNSNKH